MTQPFIRTPEDAIAIRASNLQKTYAGTVPKTALHDVSLDYSGRVYFRTAGTKRGRQIHLHQYTCRHGCKDWR